MWISDNHLVLQFVTIRVSQNETLSENLVEQWPGPKTLLKRVDDGYS